MEKAIIFLCKQRGLWLELSNVPFLKAILVGANPLLKKGDAFGTTVYQIHHNTYFLKFYFSFFILIFFILLPLFHFWKPPLPLLLPSSFILPSSSIQVTRFVHISFVQLLWSFIQFIRFHHYYFFSIPSGTSFLRVCFTFRKCISGIYYLNFQSFRKSYFRNCNIIPGLFWE